jgi:hypothetical protein
VGRRLQKLLNAGNVLKATPDKSGFCPRCRQDVRTIRPWPHWRKVRYGYFAGLGVALLGFPVILVDGFVLIPSLMIFIAAIGPLNSLVAKKPTCAQCGSPADKLRALRLVSRQPDAGSEQQKRGPRTGG